MNKLLPIRTAVIYLSAALLILSDLKAQTIQYLSPFDIPAGNNNSFQLAGKIDSTYLLYYSRPFAFPELYYFDEKGHIKETLQLNFIKPGLATNVNMITLPTKVNIIVQEIRNSKHYTFAVTIKGSGTVPDDPRYIDSTRFDLYGSSAFYSVLSSPDKKKCLLYRIIRGFSSFQVMFNGILLDENNIMLGSTSFYIPLNAELEQTGNLFINNNGKLFFPVFDKATNYRVGTNLRLYESSFDNKPPRITEIYLKENKPTDFLLDWHEARQQLVLGGLYYNFYNKRIDGAMTVFLSSGNSKPDTIIYIPLERDFKKELKSRIYNISTTAAVNSMQLRYFDIAENGSVTLLTDMFTNSSFGRNNAMAGLNWETPTETAYRQSLGSANAINSQPGTRRDVATPRSGATVNSVSRTFPQSTLSAPSRIRNSPNLAGTGNAEGFGQNESSRLNQPYKINNSVNSGDIMVINKTLDYKSVIFSIDSALAISWKNWARSLYVPGTPFSNVIIMPQKNSFGLLNYEMNSKNTPYLLCQSFQFPGKKIAQPIGKAGDPMLFFKKNAIIIDSNSMLTLYSDPEHNKMGLAIIKW